jgi:hypothetical protein
VGKFVGRHPLGRSKKQETTGKKNVKERNFGNV